MTNKNDFLSDFHWLMDVLQHIDVGLVILDRSFHVQLWNAFMQNHSAIHADDILGKPIFDMFPELPKAWFKRKAQTVFELNNQAFTTWEQRPYLFHFKSYRPITSIADHMYQNSTIIPLKNVRGEVEQICLVIYDVTEVAVNRQQMQIANEQLGKLSRMDGLTGMLNRKTWEYELEQEFNRYQRHHHTSSLLMLDIDHFKKINDIHGHIAGDKVIRGIAYILQESLRNIDVAGRYGGEEFAIILNNTDADSARIVAERIRKAVEMHAFTLDDTQIQCTISIGIAEINDSTENRTDWIRQADKGLYQAKHDGRNTIIVNSD